MSKLRINVRICFAILISKVAIQRCSCETNLSNLGEHLGNTCEKSFLSKAAGCNSETSVITNWSRAKDKARGLNHELAHTIFLELTKISFQERAIDNLEKFLF